MWRLLEDQHREWNDGGRARRGEGGTTGFRAGVRKNAGHEGKTPAPGGNNASGDEGSASNYGLNVYPLGALLIDGAGACGRDYSHVLFESVSPGSTGKVVWCFVAVRGLGEERVGARRSSASERVVYWFRGLGRGIRGSGEHLMELVNVDATCFKGQHGTWLYDSIAIRSIRVCWGTLAAKPCGVL